VDRIERDDCPGRHAEFGQQHLCGRNFVGFLGDIDVGQHKGGGGGERARHLGCGTIDEIVEAAGFAPGLLPIAARRASILWDISFDMG